MQVQSNTPCTPSGPSSSLARAVADDSGVGLSGLRGAASSGAQGGQRAGVGLAEALREDLASIDHDGDADISDASDGGSGDESSNLDRAAEAGHDASTIQFAPFKENGEADYEGEVLRKISRMQAISNKQPLSVWRREWCVASHNFLVFFASRTDLAVKKCVLFSSLRADTAMVRRDGRTFEVMLDTRDREVARADARENLEKLVLRVPRRNVPHGSPPSKDGDDTQLAEARRWVTQIQQRANFAAGLGRRLVPCMPLAEARNLTERFQAELNAVAEHEEMQLKRQLASERHRALAASLGALLTAKVQARMRGAFEELVLHVRVQALCQVRLLAAGRRLARALDRPRQRQFREAFESWADTVSAETEAAQQVVAIERQRAHQKAVHLGVAMLSALLRDREQAAVHHALVQLCRHAEGSRRQEAPSQSQPQVAFLSTAEDPAVAAAQQLRVGSHFLRAALRNLQASRRDWALRTWSIMAARSQQAEAQELLRCTAELNEQLAERCKQVPLESGIGALVLSIHAAQMRRVLFAFVALAAVPANNALQRNDACQSKLHTVQSGTLLCAAGDQEQLSFSPPPRLDCDSGTSPAVRQLFPTKLAPSPIPLRTQTPAQVEQPVG